MGFFSKLSPFKTCCGGGGGNKVSLDSDNDDNLQYRTNAESVTEDSYNNLNSTGSSFNTTSASDDLDNKRRLLRELPPAAIRAFKHSGLTEKQAIANWDVFLNCLYYSTPRKTFDKPPPPIPVSSRVQREMRETATVIETGSFSEYSITSSNLLSLQNAPSDNNPTTMSDFDMSTANMSMATLTTGPTSSTFLTMSTQYHSMNMDDEPNLVELGIIPTNDDNHNTNDSNNNTAEDHDVMDDNHNEIGLHLLSSANERKVDENSTAIETSLEQNGGKDAIDTENSENNHKESMVEATKATEDPVEKKTEVSTENSKQEEFGDEQGLRNSASGGDDAKPVRFQENTKDKQQQQQAPASPVMRRRKTKRHFSREERARLVTEANPKEIFTAFREIGRGAYGRVYIATKKAEKKKYAVKHMRRNWEEDGDSIANEITLLDSCRHANIVNYITSYLWSNQVWIVMEYCDAGTLKQLLVIEMSEVQIANVAQQVLQGIHFLHSAKRIHRDIKSSNILLNMNGDVKVADLGLCVESNDEDGTYGMAGSKYWMAPEMIKRQPYTTTADIWSLGALTYEMAEGLPPYAGYKPLKALFYSATRGAPALKKPEKWSSDFTSFLEQCFQTDPVARPSAASLLEHPFIKKACDKKELVKALKLVFLMRVTAGL